MRPRHGTSCGKKACVKEMSLRADFILWAIRASSCVGTVERDLAVEGSHTRKRLEPILPRARENL